MTEDGFIRSVCELPLSDGPRLVYADWLEERGDVRGQFIRVQCRIAAIQQTCLCGECVKLRGGGQHTNGPCNVDRERDELPDGRSRQAFLRQRQKELLDMIPYPDAGPPENNTNRYRWLRDALDDLHFWHGSDWLWRRGFVEEVTTTLSAYLGTPCEACGSRGFFGNLRPTMTCGACGGSGFDLKVARELFSKSPVLKITFEDRRPSGSDDQGEVWWYNGGAEFDYAASFGRHHVPWCLFRRLDRKASVTGDNYATRIYESTAAANADLSRAAVALGRELNNLPSVEPQVAAA